ncbi:hypothetical protein NX784_25685 [Massilia pinisoli]|uniref:DUF6985 domain-containing protein n=1 Tax=Massilia pinisoli TaxID=1772194 RepID=A0ABT1ZYH5_9BURK|nr:hypothetical protein [Massilia pinisoli]MCS0584985.1 hypothetical protein [Massilia pinisoli]
MNVPNMFGLFKSRPCHHPDLGTLTRSRGMWRGALRLASHPVPVAVSGTRQGPDAAALAAACAAPGLLPGWMPIVARALFDHYAPGLDAYRRGEFDTADDPFPLISKPAEVWKHVKLVFLAASPVDGQMMTELGYETAWDIEHTLCARFVGNDFIELNGSVLPP